MLDGKKLGKEICDILALKDEKTIRHWQNIAMIVCEHFRKNAEIPEGISVATSAGSGKTTSKGSLR